jgi:Domain of unknown function (DUF2019)
MKRINLQDMTLEQLVKRFLDIALAEYDAREREDTARYNRLFDQMTDLMAEFLTRPVQQRRALMALYEHPNPQVRYLAALFTQDIDPQAARRVCEIISERNEYPQAANARRMIDNLDKGPYDFGWILERAKRTRSEG